MPCSARLAGMLTDVALNAGKWVVGFTGSDLDVALD